MPSTAPMGATRSANKIAGGRAAAHVQDTILGLELKIISPESAEALPHLTYQVSTSRSTYDR